MDQRSKIPALALLGLSFTQCTGREPSADPIVGDWRAVQVDGDKHPYSPPYGRDGLRGERLHIDDDLAGEMSRYQSEEYDGLEFLGEMIADLVVDTSAAPKYRIDVAYDVLQDDGDGDESEPSDPTGAGTGSADTGAPDPGGTDTGGADEGDFAGDADVKPLRVPSLPDHASGALVFDCTLDGDTLTCDRAGADTRKHWIFARVTPEDDA